jgi:hypothetical protein
VGEINGSRYGRHTNQSASTRGNRFHINRAGFRGVDFTWRKPEGVYRIAFLGDSITYGGGSILDRDLFVNRVAYRLSLLTHYKIEAINLSAPGWGIQNVAAYIETQGLPEIDLLVWVIPAVDFRRTKKSLEDSHFPDKKPWSRLMYVTSSLICEVYKGLVQWLGESKKSVGGDPTILDDNVQVLKHVLAQSAKRGNRIMVAFVPSRENNQSDREDLVVFRLAAESLSIPCLDLGPVFERHRFEKLFLDRAHLASEGHKAVADEMVGFLVNQFSVY